MAHEGTGSTAGGDVPSAPSEIGDRIAAILDAAEASAERIRTDARGEAAQIVREAHERAARRVAELTAEPERLRDEAARDADRTRADADAYAAATRSQADAYAAETRTKADAYSTETRTGADTHARELGAQAQSEADGLRRAAQEDVRRIEDEGRRRQEELAAKLRELERVREGAIEHVRGAIAGMRSAADRLEHDTLPAAGVRPEELAAAAAGRGLGRIFRRGAGPESAAAAPATPAPTETPSEDLYARAKELGIRGRSKMTREQLEEAVRVAQTPNGEPL